MEYGGKDKEKARTGGPTPWVGGNVSWNVPWYVTRSSEEISRHSSPGITDDAAESSLDVPPDAGGRRSTALCPFALRFRPLTVRSCDLAARTRPFRGLFGAHGADFGGREIAGGPAVILVPAIFFVGCATPRKAIIHH